MKCEYDGKGWTKQASGYYQCTTQAVKPRWLHQYKYQKEVGAQPKGMAVHHKDLDKDNNDISNLELMDKIAHSSMHSRMYFDDKDNYAKQLEHLNRVRPDHVWPTDPVKWEEHRQALKAGMARMKKVTRECAYCGDEYEVLPSGKSKFCSNKCKSAMRRKLRLDDVERICIICGNSYFTNKYSKSLTCSRSCGDVHRGRTMRSAKLQTC